MIKEAVFCVSCWAQRQTHLYCRCLCFLMGLGCTGTHVHVCVWAPAQTWVILRLLTLAAPNTFLRFSLTLHPCHIASPNKSLNSCCLHTDSQSSQTVIWTVSHIHKILTWMGNTGKATQSVSNLTSHPPLPPFLPPAVSGTISLTQVPGHSQISYPQSCVHSCQWLCRRVCTLLCCVQPASLCLINWSNSDCIWERPNLISGWMLLEMKCILEDGCKNSFTLSGRLKLQGHGNLS